MLAEVAARTEDLQRLCRRFGVRRLEIFGSAARGGAGARDLDFLVDLGETSPAAYADAYFGLLESLEALFGRKIDLVTDPSVLNPVFRQSIDRTKQLIYAA